MARHTGKWADISQARVIAECGLPGFDIEPSQGTHFFQNLTSFGVGYVTLNPSAEKGILDFDSLRAMNPEHKGTYLRHVRFDRDLTVVVDGRVSKAVII